MIKRKSLFRTEHPLRDESIAVNARKSLFNKSQRDHAEEIDNKYDRLDSAMEGYRAGVENRIQRTNFERQYQRTIERLTNKGKEIIFKNIFSDLVLESLLIDEDVVREREASIRSVVEAYIDEEGGYDFLIKALENNKIPILEEIKSVSESMAKKVSNRKRKEMEKSGVADPDLIDFTLTEEEKEELEYKKKELSLPEISEMVKNKVLTVVKDERQRAKEQKELQDAIEEEVRDEVGDEATSEAFTIALESRIINKPIRETSTLYDSIFRNTFKTAVTEAGAGAIAGDDDEYEDEDRLQDDLINSAVYTAPEDDLELDLILAESLLQYTILECAYTIRLTDFTHNDLKQLSEALLN